MRTFGADISHWEGDVNWIKGMDYLPFVYYKCTDGEYFIDSQFGNNQDECDDVGIPNAPYHWWQELQDPIKQAEHFIETAGLNYKRYIVDVEPRVYYSGIYNKFIALMDRIEQLTNTIPAVYTSANYWDNFIKVSYNNRYPLLVAQYKYGLNPLLPRGATSWKIWQFTDLFWFWGCDATADGNWFNGTLEECRAWFGNYHLYNPVPPAEGLRMKSLYNDLRVRVAPNTSAQIVGHLDTGNIIEVADIGGTSGWAKIKSGEFIGNWVAVDYMGKRYMEVTE